MRFGLLIAVVAALLGIAGAPAARAGLIGDGTNTVSVNFWVPSSSVPPPACDGATNPNCENEADSMGNKTPPIPANFAEGPVDGATISVGDTQIVITNDISATFCSDGSSAGSACTDPFTGFDFVFSSGVDITGVSVDPASAPDFRPNDTAPHDGLQLLSPTRIVVDVTGAAPPIGGKLILDVSFSSVTLPPPVPEPSTWALMLLGFAGLGFAGWRRMAAQTT
jgi:PEP-CTERM motif